MRRGALLLAGILCACGGRTVLEDIDPVPTSHHDGGSSSIDPNSEGGTVDNWTTVGPGCAIVLDVRMCTPKCTQFDCCEPLYENNGSVAGVGICWIDRPKTQTCNTSCAACVHKAPGVDVCVPEYLCTGLESLSGENPCFKPK